MCMNLSLPGDSIEHLNFNFKLSIKITFEIKRTVALCQYKAIKFQSKMEGLH